MSLNATTTIRHILDAATSGKFDKATEALDNYAEQYLKEKYGKKLGKIKHLHQPSSSGLKRRAAAT